MLGDQPGVRPATVAALLAGRGDAVRSAVCTTTVAATRWRLAARCSASCGALHGDSGVWKLLDRRSSELVDVPVGGTVPRDVDTWDDYEAVLVESAGT